MPSCQGCPSASGVVVLVLLVAATNHYAYHAVKDLLTQFIGTECHQECIESHLNGSPVLDDPALLGAIKENFLLPPPPVPDTSLVDVNTFVWKDLLDWNTIQDNLLDLWKDQPPGTFVEVGAVDGEFMSQTLLLERNLSWTGLLIEPDPRSFKLLREKRRNATLIDFCVLLEPPKAEVLWIHHLVDDLPQQYISLMMARSKLAFDTLVQETSRGNTVYVKCAPLSTILLAANMTRVDFLTIATGSSGDETKIADVTRRASNFDIKTLLIQYPRSYILKYPYPEIKGYLHDMARSVLLVRFYWKKSHCVLVDSKTCVRQKYYDLLEACFRYLCDGHATVWTYE